MKRQIQEKVLNHEHGLYIHILFPITVAFLLTFIGARLFSYLWPDVYIPWSSYHIHHYVYGFYIIAAAAYLALVHSGPRGKYWIALLLGFGLGLSFDEQAFWLQLRDDDPARWSYDGFLIFWSIVFMIIAAPRSLIYITHHFPFRKHNTSSPSTPPRSTQP